MEDAALAWLGSLGWVVKHRPEIAPGGVFAERADYGQVVLAKRLRDALARLNPELPADGEGWRHVEVRLESQNPDFAPIVLRESDEGQVRVVAELVEVL